MRNIWLVAVREFSVRLRTRGFLISSLAFPVIIIIVWAASGIVNLGMGPGEADNRPDPSAGKAIGYVDAAGLIESIPAPLSADLVRRYASLEEANQALEAGAIDAYYAVPSDYIATGRVRRVSLEIPNGPVETSLFTNILTHNLLASVGAQDEPRLQDPLGPGELEFRPLDEGQAPASEGLSFVPFLVSLAITMPLFVSGGYLLQSVTQEKASRVMEILLVSLRPRQMLAGKLIGLGALTLVQYLFWIVVLGGAFLLSGQDLPPGAAVINISPAEVVWMVLFALGGYILYAAFMAGIGALASNMEASRTWVMLISMPMMVPIYLWVAITGSPHGTLAVVLSLFPLTTPVAMLMRMTSTSVPGWQVALSLFLLYLTGVGVIALMARLFRVRTLLSGEDISLPRFWAALTR